MKITILYDNETTSVKFVADWGFACLVEAHDRTILFDTGANGRILLGNIRELAIDPARVDTVVISHSHWDHTGGLQDFLTQAPDVTLYVPASFSPPFAARETVAVTDEQSLGNGFHSTGELKRIEQSLIVESGTGVIVITGCSHSGVDLILDAAASYGTVRAIIGGFHGFENFQRLSDIDVICATHCTQHIRAIRKLYPQQFKRGGVGTILRFDEKGTLIEHGTIQ